jgi:hypothetical protein
MTNPTFGIDHAATAAALDGVYASLVTLDHLLARSGLPSWKAPRMHALTAFGELHHLRDDLHTLAAGLRIASPYRAPRPAVAAAPQAPALEVTGPCPRQTETGDDDRGASVLNGLTKGATTASVGACCPREPEASPECPGAPETLTGAATGASERTTADVNPAAEA